VKRGGTHPKLPAAPLVERIRRFMAERSLAIGDDTAEQLGMTHRTLERLVREGQANVSRRVIDEVCHELGIHPAELYGGRW